MEIKDRVLVVEDDKRISNFIKTVLEANNYDVIVAQTGAEAYSMVTSQCPDVVILDLGLPDMDGMKILQGVREWSAMPVIVVSARTHERDKVEALDLGADDYITKPFDLPELLARITVQLRNTSPHLAVRHILTFQEIKLNTETHRVSVQKHPVKLTKTEYAILKLLMERPSQVMTKSALLEQISEDTPDCMESSLKVHISNLRKKLKTITDKDYIEAVWGIGFKMKED